MFWTLLGFLLMHTILCYLKSLLRVYYLPRNSILRAQPIANRLSKGSWLWMALFGWLAGSRVQKG